MTESVKSDSNNNTAVNKNLLAGAIALVILVLVAGWYMDRQGRRRLDKARTIAALELMDDWGRSNATPGQARRALGVTRAQMSPGAFDRPGVQPAAFTQVSFKNIVARIAPSVVSVNVDVSRFAGRASR